MQSIHYHFDKVDSTNTWAKDNIDRFSRLGLTLVTADEQTAGRGRFQRRWISPCEQNIYATFCFFIDDHHINLGNISQVLALAVVKTLQPLQFNVQLRWPNDLMINGKKIAGILCETVPLSQHICMLAGIGINVNMSRASLEAVDQPATSLQVEKGALIDHLEVLKQLKQTFIADLSCFLKQGFCPFLALYREKMVHSEEELIPFNDRKEQREGRFHAIGEDGALILKLPSGELKKII